MGSPLTTDKIRICIPSLLRYQRNMVRGEPKICEINEDGASNKRKSDLDDLDSCDITLKELQQRAKKRKKLLKSAGLKEQNTTGSYLDTKRDSVIVDIKEEQYDVNEPLSFWMRNGSSNSKSKRKSIRKQVCSSLESGVLEEAITREGDYPANLKSEILRSDSSDLQNPEHRIANDAAPETPTTKEIIGELPVGNIESMKPYSSSKDFLGCTINEVSFERMDLYEPMPSSSRHAGYTQTIIESPPLSQLIKECDVSSQITNHNPLEAIPSSQDMGSDTCESSNSDCDAATQLLDMEIDASSQTKEPSCGGATSVSEVNGEVNSNEDTPTHLKDDITENHSDSAVVGPVSCGADGAMESLSASSTNASNGYNIQRALPGLPRRLLSNRKAISPTSQEKLRLAVDDEELHDNEGNTSEETKISLKPKKKSSQTVPKGILKASPVSTRTPNDGIESSSIPTRAQKAVAFTQRQMQDIESLASKLMKELKSMKDIVEDNLYSNDPPRYTQDEMRNAVNNASEVEETTKRWLSMMARDCNRFCKIMSQRSSGKTTTAERKKIMFADEAGGMLCHVKILEDSHVDDVQSDSSVHQAMEMEIIQQT